MLETSASWRMKGGGARLIAAVAALVVAGASTPADAEDAEAIVRGGRRLLLAQVSGQRLRVYRLRRGGRELYDRQELLLERLPEQPDLPVKARGAIAAY